MDRSQKLEYRQVRRAYLDVVEEIDWTTRSRKSTPRMVWDLLALASVQRSTIHSTCEALQDAPTSAGIFYQLRHGWLNHTTLEELEAQLNERLAACVPAHLCGRSQEVAVDVTYLPYHGQPHQHPREVRRGPAKQGTTHFHAYASLYLMRRHQRVTLAVAYWQQTQSLLSVLQRLLARAQALDIRLNRLLVDRQFCSVQVVRYLQQQPYQTILPVPARSSLLRRLRHKTRCSFSRSYTMRSPKEGTVSFELYVVRSYLKGRYGKHGSEVHLFACLGSAWHSTPHALAKKYGARFGIESSYRQLNLLRARTASRDPKVRLLLVALAFLLLNLWRMLRWHFLSVPRRGGRYLDHSLFRLHRFCLFLLDAIRDAHCPLRSVSRPASLP